MGIFYGVRWTVLCCVFALTSAATPRKFLQTRFSVDYQPFEGPWNDDFDWGVIKEVLHKAPSNAVISPLSVKALLALLYEGSASPSETERELLQALSGGNDQTVSKLQTDLLQYKQMQQDLLITDRVFHDVSVTIMQKYHSIIVARYNASTQAVDFQDTVTAAAQINEWIAYNTRGNIQNIIKPDTLHDALMLLINTIYFKGSWSIPFPTNATVERPFYTGKRSTASRFGPRNVPYMKQRERIFYYKHSDELGAQFLRLPYDKNQLSMVVVLPDEQVSLGQLLTRLTPQSVHQALADMAEEEVEIELPRFSITYSSSMRECLQQLGISRVFTDQAELPLISRGRTTPLKVSTILQKSCILVDEQGTEASAATEGTLVFTILNQPIKFIANRPFLFLIYDEAKGNWLFAGKVEDPLLNRDRPIGATHETPGGMRSRALMTRTILSVSRFGRTVWYSCRSVLCLTMHKFSIVILCFAALLVFDAAAQNDVHGPFQGQRKNDFDLKFIKEIFKNHNSNVVLSPFSVKILLTLIYEASDTSFGNAVSNTKRELASVIQNENIELTRSYYKQLLESAQQDNKDFDLNIATNFFVDDFIEVINKYQQIANTHYHAMLEKVSYSNPTQAAATINNWVSQHTNGRLREIVTPDSLEGAVITLVNVIYFKGLWTYPFPEVVNNVKPFFGSNGKQSVAQYMEQNGQFYYDNSADLGAQILRLPYRGDKLAMYFILPNQDSSINQVLDRINSGSLHQALWYMEENEVNVTIPKFKYDFSEQLNEPLQQIGIREIFSQNASLPLLARGRGARDEVRVSRIFQKAGITINEVGSEAYAATEIQLVNKFGGDGVQIFNANRPFIFFIEDETLGSMLFAGKIENPVF
ncbi:uncharacterized protein LOC118514604 [Anopheles stephensi]|uniref:uncharacterized protein LOC118514604 n=1 Tax=Anopheles stephensi TaxID=30069 RepID=UPI00165895DE|nr:uncharacterized protein LOC118514604 [Anopheles stephensi]